MEVPHEIVWTENLIFSWWNFHPEVNRAAHTHTHTHTRARAHEQQSRGGGCAQHEQQPIQLMHSRTRWILTLFGSFRVGNVIYKHFNCPAFLLRPVRCFLRPLFWIKPPVHRHGSAETLHITGDWFLFPRFCVHSEVKQKSNQMNYNACTVLYPSTWINKRVSHLFLEISERAFYI